MKQPILIKIFAVALAISLISGCERFRNLTGSAVNFSAGISSDKSSETKVGYGSLDTLNHNQAIEWKSGDIITVYCDQCDGVKRAGYVVSQVRPSGTSSDSYAQISNQGASGLIWGTGRHHFYAVYPGVNTAGAPATTITGNIVTGNIPASQSFESVSVSDNKVVAPDMTNLYMTADVSVDAGTSAGNVFLDFLPLTTVLEFTITNKFEENQRNMLVSSVSLISDDHYLSGGFSVNLDSTVASTSRPLTTTSGSGLGKKVTIDLSGSNVSVAYGKTLTFTFFLNPGNASNVDDLTFEIKGTNTYNNTAFTRKARLEYSNGTGYAFKTHKKTNIKGIMVPETISWEIEGDVSVVTWNSDAERTPTFEKGYFSVGRSKKVEFSKGNLYYDSSSATFKFESNQYDYRHTRSSNNDAVINGASTRTPQNTIGSFLWSKTARVAYASTYSDSGKAIGDVFFTNQTDSTSKAGFTVNGEKGWRVLSTTEWQYLFNTRSGVTIGSVSDARYAEVKVNGIKGLLIFPDSFAWPSGISTSQPATFNTYDSDWNNVNYSTSEFQKLSTAGCVFLPAAGYRKSGDDAADYGDYGRYWSATSHVSDATKAYGINFYPDSISSHSENNRSYARTIRLVRDVN